MIAPMVDEHRQTLHASLEDDAERLVRLSTEHMTAGYTETLSG